MPQATLPPWIETLKQRDPEFVASYMSQREKILADGAIPAKYKHLMTMIVDALLAHADGVATIANRASAAGASEAEILEAVEVAYLFGGTPGLVTAVNAFRPEALEAGGVSLRRRSHDAVADSPVGDGFARCGPLAARRRLELLAAVPRGASIYDRDSGGRGRDVGKPSGGGGAGLVRWSRGRSRGSLRAGPRLVAGRLRSPAEERRRAGEVLGLLGAGAARRRLEPTSPGHVAACCARIPIVVWALGASRSLERCSGFQTDEAARRAIAAQGAISRLDRTDVVEPTRKTSVSGARCAAPRPSSPDELGSAGRRRARRPEIWCDGRSCARWRMAKPALASSHCQSSGVYLLWKGKRRKPRRKLSASSSPMTSRR